MISTANLLVYSVFLLPVDLPSNCCDCHSHAFPATPIASAALGDVSAAGTPQAESQRPPAPLVRLRGFSVGVAQHQGELTSTDTPELWPSVPLAKYSVLVQLTAKREEVNTPDDRLGYVQLLLDGKALDNKRYLVPPCTELSLERNRVRLTYTYQLPCVAPGRHLLQARYVFDSRWSHVSAPLRFDVRHPDPPRIVAMSDLGRNPVPLKRSGLISITESSVKLRLARVDRNARVVAYLDGKPITTDMADPSCCRIVKLEGHITPGIHAITVRTIHAQGSCSITSDSSNEVVFHYYDEDVYLLRPNRRCYNCPAPADAGSQRSHSETPSCNESAPSQRSASGSSIASERSSRGIQLVGFAQDHHDSPFRTASLSRQTAQGAANIRLVAFLAESPDDPALRFRNEAINFAAATDQPEKDVEFYVKEAREQASGADAAAQAAATASTNAEEERLRAHAAAAVADKAAQVAVLSNASKAEDARDDVAAARTAAAAAFQIASTAAQQAATEANEATQKAQEAKQVLADMLTVKTEVETARRLALEAAEQTKKLAAEAAALVNQDIQKAREKRGLAELERNRAKDWLDIARQKVRSAADLAKNAEDCRRQADAGNVAAQNQMLKARAAAGNTGQNAVNARSAAMTAAQQAIDAAILSIADTIRTTDAALSNLNSAVADANSRAASARTLAAEAKAAADAAASDAAQAKVKYEAAERSANEANSHVAKAQGYVAEEHQRGDAARLRVAQIHAKRAAENCRAAHAHKQLAADAYNRAVQEAGKAQQASGRAQANAAIAGRGENNAKQHAVAAAAARGDVVTAETTARDALTIAQRAAAKSDLDLAAKALQQALDAKQSAESRSVDAKSERSLARQSADAITPTVARVDGESTAAKAARQRAADRKNDADAAAQSTKGHAASAAQNAADAGRLLDLAKLIEKNRHISKVEAEYRATLPLLRDIDVQLAPNRVEAAEKLAAEEETYADERIAIGRARDRIERARAVEGPPSPFFFASAAHFPLRDFGPRGEVMDRPGAVIYEDMVFSFDRDGNYNLRFTIETPAMPTTIHMQLLLQPGEGRPWYTITLPAMVFRPDEGKAGWPKPKLHRDYVVEGRSEILHRCYAEMGKGATIRRTGSARFGYGLEAMSQTASR